MSYWSRGVNTCLPGTFWEERWDRSGLRGRLSRAWGRGWTGLGMTGGGTLLRSGRGSFLGRRGKWSSRLLWEGGRGCVLVGGALLED